MLKSFKSYLSLKIFIFFSKLIFEILYLNKRAHETDRKSSSNPANIYLFKVNNGYIRTMCEICSKFRGIYRSQLKILAFVCLLFFQTFSLVDVIIPEVHNKETRTMLLTLFLCLYCWLEHVLPMCIHAYFTYFSQIFHIFWTRKRCLEVFQRSK